MRIASEGVAVTHVREKVAWALAATLALVVVASLAGVVRGGPLDPPAGTPVATDSVRVPGTPINALPLTINASGNYYLTRDLSLGVTGSAITVNADDVTIDLNGFTLHGAGLGTTAVGANTVSRLTVRNGHINSFGTGIDNPSGWFARVDDVVFQMGGSAGAVINTGDYASITHVETYDAYNAISLGKSAQVSDVSVNAPAAMGISAGDGAQMHDVRVTGGTAAITVQNDALLSRVQVVGANSVAVQGSNRVTLLDCAVSNTGGTASINLDQNAVVRGCNVGDAPTDGIKVGSFGLVEDNAIHSSSNCAIVLYGERARASDNQIAQANYAICASMLSGANAVYHNSYTGISLGIYFGPSGSLPAGPLASADTATNPFTNIAQ